MRKKFVKLLNCIIVMLLVCAIVGIYPTKTYATNHVASTKEELINAINRASNGDTITLAADIATGPNRGTEPDVIITKNITLDLGGHTLSNDGVGNHDTIEVKNAEVTLRNGTITSISGMNTCLMLGGNATATSESTMKYGNAGICAIGILAGTSNNVLDIRGGNFSTQFAIYNDGSNSTIIMNGDITCSSSVFIQRGANTVNLIITSGKFTADPSASAVLPEYAVVNHINEPPYNYQIGLKNYSITYNLNGGVNPSDVKTTYTYDTTYTYPIPTKQGFEFNGWTATTPPKGTVSDKGIVSTNYGNIVLSANWTKSLNGLDISTIPPQKYTGNEITPRPTIKDGDYTLVEGVDYEFIYKDNIDPGQATITINGLGTYAGTIDKNFTIYDDLKTIDPTTGQKIEPGKVSTAIPTGEVKTPIDEIELSQYIEGGCGDKIYELVDNKPGWLEVDPDTGKLTGTRPDKPTGAGQATVKVTDEEGNVTYIEIDIGPTYKPIIVVDSDTNKEIKKDEVAIHIPGGVIKTPIDKIDLSQYVQGGYGDKTYSIIDNHPSWIKVDPTTGQLTGTRPAQPTDADKMVVEVIDELGNKTYIWIDVGPTYNSIQIIDPSTKKPISDNKPVITIPAGEIKTPIDEIDLSEAVIGGYGKITYEKVEGPDWINVDSETGKLTGTRPSYATQATTMKIKVTDELGNVSYIIINIGEITGKNSPLKTGDTSDMTMWIVFIVISILVIVGLNVYDRKQKFNKLR